MFISVGLSDYWFDGRVLVIISHLMDVMVEQFQRIPVFS